MTNEHWRVALSATFDVENYGDLLFPLLAQSALSQRLGSVEVQPYSYHAKTAASWPYTVNSLTEFPDAVPQFSAVIIGGGQVIRFDKDIAPGYQPPTPDIHHPTGYWLSPGLLALQHNVPLIWNTPGCYGNVPAWAVPLVKLTLEQGSYISVRDTDSIRALSHISAQADIHLVADSAFGISRLVDTAHPSANLLALRKQYGLEKPYIIVQATRYGLMFFCRMLQQHPKAFEDYKFLLLPIGPAVGDHADALPLPIPDLVQLPFWPQPLLIAELISHAEGVVGSSYHLAITALAFGVPVFSTVDLSRSKLAPLAAYENIYPLPIEGDIYPPWFLKRLGKAKPGAAVLAAQQALDVHWDRIAQLIRRGATNSATVVNAYWRNLPSVLEEIAIAIANNAESDATAAALRANAKALLRSQKKYDARTLALRESQQEVHDLNRRLNKIYRSHSYRIAAPLRWLSRVAKNAKRLLKNSKEKESKHD